MSERETEYSVTITVTAENSGDTEEWSFDVEKVNIDIYKLSKVVKDGAKKALTDLGFDAFGDTH